MITSNTASVERAIHLQTEPNEPNLVSWPAGNYITRINVTTGNANLDWDENYVCRMPITCILSNTIGSAVAQAVSLTAGVKSITVAGALDSGLLADTVFIVGGIARVAGHGSQSATITNDQVVDTPFAAVGAIAVKDPIMGPGIVPFPR